MKFEIKKRWTDEVAFTVEIDPPENASDGVKTALAVKWAAAAGIVLSGLVLNLGEDGYIDDCTITDCRVAGGTIIHCRVDDCTITDCRVAGGTITDCRVAGGTIIHCRVARGTVTGGWVTGGWVTDCRVAGGTITDCRVVEVLPIPSIENIHKKVFEAAQREGAFNMSDWGPGQYDPQCKTTRCRAGIVVNEAGEAGYALKDQIGWEGAAWLIYKASDPEIERVPNFYATNDEALADMKRLAEKEAMT